MIKNSYLNVLIEISSINNFVHNIAEDSIYWKNYLDDSLFSRIDQIIENTSILKVVVIITFDKYVIKNFSIMLSYFLECFCFWRRYFYNYSRVSHCRYDHWFKKLLDLIALLTFAINCDVFRLFNFKTHQYYQSSK